MITKQRNFCRTISISHIAICAVAFAIYSIGANGASVVARGTSSTTNSTVSASSRPTVTSSLRGTAARMPTTTINTATTTETEPEVTEPEETVPVAENKTSQFDAVLSTSGINTTDSSADNLAEMIRQQRAELDAQDAISTANASLQSGGANACDKGLRTCMQEKCGTDFTECSGDTDTLWGNKMDACRRDLDCTGEEYRLFAAEIKSDRDMNARLASYNAVINCGNQYNNCIMTECGETFSKCLGKTAGDAAIAKCKTIADNCVQQDSGLSSRAMQVFANLRQYAEVQVQKDEERLYSLRDQMSQQCTALGAMFDERTFSCVFTVNFYAGEDSTLYASKKLYAGDIFDCTPNWFGIDVTTFMENAYRLTREQTSASSALLGSGLGVAAGAITSGAINRAIDRQKADKALEEAKAEHEFTYGDTAGSDETSEENTEATTQEEKTVISSSRPSSEELKKKCEEVGGTWKNNICSQPKCDEGQIYDDFNGGCKENTNIPYDELSDRCKIAGGVWNSNNFSCICYNGGTFNTKTGICECGENQKLENGKCVLDLQMPSTYNSQQTGTATVRDRSSVTSRDDLEIQKGILETKQDALKKANDVVEQAQSKLTDAENASKAAPDDESKKAAVKTAKQELKDAEKKQKTAQKEFDDVQKNVNKLEKRNA